MKAKKLISVLLSAFMLVSLISGVSLAADSVSIDGPASLVSAPEGTYSAISYTASCDGVSSADSAQSFSWTVEKAGSKAEDVFFEDGNLIVAGGANGIYTLTAAYGDTAIGTKDIEIKASTPADYKNYSSNVNYTSDTAMNTTGFKTLEFTLNIPSASQITFDGYNRAEIIIEKEKWKGFYCLRVDGNDTQYKIYYSPVETNLRPESNPSSGNDILFNYGEDYNFKVVYNLSASPVTHRFYLDGILIGMYVNSVVTSDFTSGHTKEFSLRTGSKPVFTNFVEYSGVETSYEPKLPTVTVDAKSLLIPSGTRQLRTKLTATADTAGDITWSIPTPYEGVSITDSGILRVSSGAAPGSVTVRATLGAVYGEAQITLSKVIETIDASTAWKGGTAASDDTGYYMPVDSRYEIPDAARRTINDDFNLVIEQDIRMNTANTSPKIQFILSDNSWLPVETARVASSEWVNLKVIIKSATGEMMALLNDAPINLYGADLSNVQKLTSDKLKLTINELKFERFDLKNLKFYNASDNLALVQSFKTPGYAAPNGTVTVTDVVIFNEDMNSVTNEYKWFVFDPDTEEEEEIPGQTSSTLDLSTLNLGECFVRAKVRANHQSVISGDETLIEGEWKSGEPCQVADFVVGGPLLRINGTEGDINNIEITVDNSTAELIISPLHTGDTPREILIVLAQYDSLDSGKTLINISPLVCTSEKMKMTDRTVSLSGLKAGSIVRAFIWDAKTYAPIK